MKRGILIAAGAIVVLTAAAAAVLALHGGTAASTAGHEIPAGAQASVRLLLSADGHRALTPELDSFLPKGQLFPAGTTFTAKPGSWHQVGAYANVTGALRMPGKSPVKAEIGLVHRGGHWLVTSEARQ
jgi:hypothetical protein